VRRFAAFCLAALAAVGCAATADADQDREFYRLATVPDQAFPVTIFNFNAVKAQALECCALMDSGMGDLAATE
jgi:hypothetical protein